MISCSPSGPGDLILGKYDAIPGVGADAAGACLGRVSFGMDVAITPKFIKNLVPVIATRQRSAGTSIIIEPDMARIVSIRDSVRKSRDS